MQLSTLLEDFRRLETKGATNRDKAERGYAFERLLTTLFREQDVSITDPFRIVGEQIDGAFVYGGWTYLVEAKWQSNKKSTADLYAFQGKVDRRIEGTRGLFISMSGFHSTSVDALGRGRKPNILLWTKEHLEAVLTGLATIPELLDLSIRFAAERGELLVAPQILLDYRREFDYPAVLQACGSQVEAEIASMVGNKFVPGLYVGRRAQVDLDVLIHPERHSTLPPDCRTTLTLIPKCRKGRMHVILGRAGTGKTNLMCHAAKKYSREKLAIFLTGRSGVTERTSIQELLELRLNGPLACVSSRQISFGNLVSLAQRNQRDLLIFIDGINEHRNSELLNVRIAQFLREIRGKPVVVVTTCRDVYWPFFDTSLWPEDQWSVWKGDLDAYSPTELQDAVRTYFDFYKINASLSHEALSRLSHPLLLRFFCDAYGDPSSSELSDLGHVSDIRLRSLFDDYLHRKSESIRHTAPRRRRTTRDIEGFVFQLADLMLQKMSRSVRRDDVVIRSGQMDLESPESLYVAILGEDIILEEEPDQGTTGCTNILFTYDEFMEYVIARAMLRSYQSMDENTAQRLVTRCTEGMQEFPTLLGVLEYLAVFMREDHDLDLWETIGLADVRVGLCTSQAIEKLEPTHVADPELRALERMIVSPHQEQQIGAVDCLMRIANRMDYRTDVRKRAIEILASFLMHAEAKDTVVCVQVLQSFPTPEAIAISNTAASIAAWWRAPSEKATEQAIVVSDDHEATMEILRAVLEDEGYRMIYCEPSSYRCLELIKKVKPALLVTDLAKPEMDGRELALAVKASPDTSKVPILLLSGLAGSIDWDPVELSRLYCGCMRKPFHVEQFINAVRLCLAGPFGENERT